MLASRFAATTPPRNFELIRAPDTVSAPRGVAARIGQVIWPAVRASRGEAALAALEPLFERYPPGGVIVFGEGERQVDRLLEKLRQQAPAAVLVAADLERGCGQHVREYSSLPPAMAIAACRDPEVARQAGLLTALEARQAGIDVVLAPVADVNTSASNPIISTRSFGDDPALVSALACAFAAGLAQGGVLAVAKHFPGHGASQQDSHVELARVNRSREAIEAVDLPPFEALIEQRVGGILVGHLEVPALDPVPGRPATMSTAIVRDLLRGRMGYDGLVITDALDMGGFAPQRAACLEVLLAGLDVLLMPADPWAAAQELERHHAEGRLEDDVLDAAVARITAARNRVRRPPDGVAPPDPALAESLLQGSITSNGVAAPPLVAGPPVDVTLFGEDDSGIVAPAFREALEASGVCLGPGGRRVGLVLTSVRARLGSARLAPLHRRRLQWAIQHGRLDLVVVLGSPYEMLALPSGQPALLAYEANPATAQQVARVATGQAQAPGRLPVGRDS